MKPTNQDKPKIIEKLKSKIGRLALLIKTKRDNVKQKKYQETAKLIVAVAVKNTPVLDTVFSTLESMSETFEKIEKDERAYRITNYLAGIYKYESELRDKDLSRSDFISIVNKVAADDEGEKLPFYVKLTIALAEGGFSQKQKTYFIRLLNNLTVYEIQYAKELYTRKTIPLIGYPSFDDAQEVLTESKDGASLRAINALISWGLIDSFMNDLSGRDKYDIGDNMTAFINMIYDRSDITAESIGEQPKELYDLIIIDRHSMNNMYTEFLSELLSKHNIRVGIVNRTESIDGTLTLDVHLNKVWAPYYLHNQDLVQSRDVGGMKYVQIALGRDGKAQSLLDMEKLTHSRIDWHLFTGANKTSKENLNEFQKALTKIGNAIIAKIQPETKQNK
ncbi:hypothetical protein N0P70_005516 [Klebsiella michiganensis]|nr:hypothetical protein [Klebsiella michiganensis]